MNLHRIKTLVEHYTAADLEATILRLEACFIVDESIYDPVGHNLTSIEADIEDYTKALTIREQVETNGISFQEALRDLATRMRRFAGRKNKL